MTDIEKLIEDLRGLLKQYGEKIPYGELVGAPWPYSRAGDLVWQDPEPYFIEQAATAISTLQAENEKLRAELEQVKQLYESEKENFIDFACSGVPNLSPYCLNRHPDCVDERGWCKSAECHGFSRNRGQKED